MKNGIMMGVMCLLTSAIMSSCGQKFPDYKKTETGLYYKEIVKGEGKHLDKNDIALVNIAYYNNDNDSLLFTTSVYPENTAYLGLDASYYKGDIFEGLLMMSVGDSMSFLTSADSVYRKQFVKELPSFMKPDTYLRWEVKVLGSMTKDEYEQMVMKQQEAMQQREAAIQQAANDEFEAYLKENGVKTPPTASGLVYVCTKKGKGPHPGYKQNVKVHYTGKLLDGTVFDSSIERGEPIEFELGVGMVIAGWDEGIAMMSKGEKGILYIPSYLAYGSRQVGPDIKPYSNLVFEVELVDFE